MEIKYDAVFGDQSLFDNDQSDAIVVVSFDDGAKVFIDAERYKNQSPLFGYNGSFSIAMRRIIRTPTWTVADQKAGKLPEVGCRIYVPVMIEEQTVIYSSEKVIVSISDNGGAVTRTEVGSINRIKPIESPEEKAARLRNKWCNRAMDCSTIQQLYDAMLSGEIPVPAAPEQNK